VQKRITAWIAAHDCDHLRAFADSRKYYGLVKAGSKLPKTPDDWNLDYLTWPELKRLAGIIMSLEGASQLAHELTPADIQFLTGQCAIYRGDVDVIAQLDVDMQSRISSWIGANDCNQLRPFKDSREYY
jgi:hypothetical protein